MRWDSLLATGSIARTTGSIALGLTLLAGCDGSGTDAGTPDGIPVWDVTRVHEIGSIDDPEETLTRVGTVVLGPAGGLFVGQTDDAAIRVYDADEAFRGTIGRRGEGPGEIGGLQTFGIEGSRIWVLDQGNGRLTWFTMEGDYESDEPWSPQPTYDGRASINYAFPLRFRLRPDGSSMAIPGVLQILQPGESEPPPTPAIVTLTSAAEIQDTVVLQSLEVPDAVPDDYYTAFPTDPEYDLTARGDGVVVVERAIGGSPAVGSFRMLRIDEAGDTVVDRAYRYDPVTPGADLEQRLFDGLSETLQRRYRDRIYVPASYPPVSDLVVTQDGTVWVAREEISGAPVEWWAIDPDEGDVRGTITLPAGHTVVAGAGDILVTRREDDFEVPYVVRWRITR